MSANSGTNSGGMYVNSGPSVIDVELRYSSSSYATVYFHTS